MIKQDFRLLSFRNCGEMNLSPLDSGNRVFEGVSAMPEDRYAALFAWAKSDESDFNSQPKIAEVEYEKLAPDGLPENPIVVGIREWDLPFKHY